MADKKKGTAKVIPFPSRPRKVVRAAKVEYSFATCTCSNKIKLEPGPLRQIIEGIPYPVLVATICPNCRAQVRLDSEDSTCGWLLMHNSTENVKLPITEWEQLLAFDTAAECAIFIATRLVKAEEQHCEFKLERYRCVPADVVYPHMTPKK
jgi:hypothetical protein